MNFDLIAVLLLLSGIGIFLSVVMGRMQIQQYDELEKDLQSQYQALKDLEEGYKSLTEAANSPDYGEILPMFTDNSGKLRVDRRANYLTTGRIAKRVLALSEAIEHVDGDEKFFAECLGAALREFGMDEESSGSHEDLKAMLRMAKECIHARLEKQDVEYLNRRLQAMKAAGHLDLSNNGRMRMREFMSVLYRPEMKPLRDDYLHFFPLIEEILLGEEPA